MIEEDGEGSVFENRKTVSQNTTSRETYTTLV